MVLLHVLHLTAQKQVGLQRQQSWYKICCNILLGLGIRLLNVEFLSLGHLVQLMSLLLLSMA